VLVVLDADLDASGRRAVGRFFGDVADAVVVADGALAAGARDTMDDLGETPTNAATAARYADGVVSGLLASQLALRANARHERMADTVLDVAGVFRDGALRRRRRGESARQQPGDRQRRKNRRAIRPGGHRRC
jgi:hypothetical protein